MWVVYFADLSWYCWAKEGTFYLSVLYLLTFIIEENDIFLQFICRKWTYSSLCLSLATSSAHLEDLAYLDEQQRHIPSRTSLRMPRQNSGNRSQLDHRGKCMQTHILSSIFFQAALWHSSLSLFSCSSFHPLSQPEAPPLRGTRAHVWLAVHRQGMALPGSGRLSSRWRPVNQPGCGHRRQHGLWQNSHHRSSASTQLSWKPDVANRCRQPDHAKT